MFTGIIEGIGVIQQVTTNSLSSKLTIKTPPHFLDDTKLGDSIAVNGVCLTVTNIVTNNFIADVMNETMSITNLSSLKTSDQVNLEKALRLSDRLGGHIVSGHIDGVGKISNITKLDIAHIITISCASNLLRYIIQRGSITIDGISLTVIKTGSDWFQVSIIPHTSQETTLLSKKINATVNLETDITAKYIEKLIFKSQKEIQTDNITEEFLKKHGF